MDLKIKYKNGSMVVHLEEFLNCRNITKVRKLVKLIHQSVNPDDVGKIRMYIEQQLEKFEPRIKEDDLYIAGYIPKLKFSKRQLEKSICIRSRFKRNSVDWMQYSKLIKECREEIRELKAQIRNRESDRNDCIRNKIFYEKVLETIS